MPLRPDDKHEPAPAPPVPEPATSTSAPPTILPICQDIAGRVNAFLDSEPETPLLRQVQAQTRVALGVISAALERYSLPEISLSYNGGKDCLVLLILLLASLAHHPPATLPPKLQSVYIISPHPFAEVDEFVDGSIDTYRLDLARYTQPMKEAFRVYLREHAGVKAILVGTRRTDPHGEVLTHFDATDHGWPAFMRVHPVIDWHYAEIWAFIRHLEIPYCVLYDRGYTSLGGTTDTHPNPALKAGNVQSETKEQSFRPAYELVEDKAERLGRDW
ncbi:putative FAD synthase [Lachnellula cervina]|uniref:FAD synthase n=1 Tax=Lachnellula cervina TaxID=1316786 RepID=A0A7D8YZF8_9HELO|nr:putative FAD synthase [Lachnellula cervina]